MVMSSEMARSAPAATKAIELADILIRHAGAFFERFRPPLRYLKVAQRIMACRTSILGGHLKWCGQCDYRKYVYHSCRNRHCPKCQSQAKEAWREARQLDLLPVPYFHQFFTLPHELNEWILAGEENQRALLKLLFDSASATLSEFGRGELGGQVGFTLVLHTWDQQLRPHFHLHGLIASRRRCRATGAREDRLYDFLRASRKRRPAAAAPRLSSTPFYRSSLRDETIKRFSFCQLNPRLREHQCHFAMRLSILPSSPLRLLA
ncbi:MAG: transposase zinc-binding domain-containing protein [Candidatus Paceibacterota bacterium]